MSRIILASFVASASALTVPTVAHRSCAPKMSLSAGEQELIAKFGLPAEQLKTDRRSALGLMGAAAASAPLFAMVGPAAAQDGMFSLPPLPYAYDAVRARARDTFQLRSSISPTLPRAQS